MFLRFYILFIPSNVINRYATRSHQTRNGLTLFFRQLREENMVSPLKKNVPLLFAQFISCHDNFVILWIKETRKHRLQDGNLIGKNRVSHLVSQIQLILIKDWFIIQKFRNWFQVWQISYIFLLSKANNKPLQETISFTKRHMNPHTDGNLPLHGFWYKVTIRPVRLH